MKFLLIVLMCVAAAVLYGVVHDQVTVRICPEYFTVFHPPSGFTSPTLVALYWGVVATWWMGAGLGLLVAAAARFGGGPKVEPREVLFPLVTLLLFAMGLAIVAGIAGGIGASNGWVRVWGDLKERIPPGRHTGFLIDFWAHNASYAAGAVGGVFLAGWIAGRRSEHKRLTAQRMIP